MSSKLKRGTSSKLSDDGLDDDMDEKGVIKRKSRNLSEKKRRDQFNILINELCSMVCSGKRKMDKSTILKSAISFIRNHNQVTMQSHCQETAQEDWKPSFLSNEEFTHLMLEALDEFIVVFTIYGKILYVSENVTSLLGHTPNNMLGSMITDLVWPEESNMVQSVLSSWRSNYERDGDVNLSCHLRRRGNPGESDADSKYELVNFSGYLRVQGNSDMACMSRLSSSWGDDSKESSNCGEALAQYNGLVFVGSARLQTPQLLVEMSIIDVSKSEFTSRHSLEWKFLFLDHRGPPIIGYLPFEVLGTSGYDYYHIDDLEKVAACHEALMQKGEVTSCCYRFLTKGQQWIWLQTKYYITYHQWYSKPEFIVCSHRVINYSEVAGGHYVKLENANNSNHAEIRALPVESIRSNRPEGKSTSSLHSSNKSNKLINKGCVQDESFNSERRSSDSSIKQARSNNKQMYQQRFYQQQSCSSASDTQQLEMSSYSGDSVLLSPPPPVPSSNESMSRQNSRHPSGSSRAGAAMSDTGSISSSGSFQSAASYSDHSMHSIQSQQSHHSMQSVQSQQHQHAQHSHANNSLSSSSQTGSGQHSSVNVKHSGGIAYQQPPPQGGSSATSAPARTTTHFSRTGETLTRPATSGQPGNSNLTAGHRFLQPRLNSGVSAIRRVFTGSSAGSAETANMPTSNAASNSAPDSLTYHQSVVPLVESANLTSAAGVTLPVGVPVVTLPGLLHEPLVLTPAQRNLHEQLRLKHMEIQKSIIAQQEELRRVSEKLILAQYGAWGPTVLKMAVPYSEDADGSSSQATTHAVLHSAGGLVTCLTTESPISLGQITSSPQLTSGVGTMTFSPGASILVHSPEFHALSPTERTNDSIGISADPSQMVLRTALQQEALVQLSQQDIQMLLQHSNFLP